MAGKRSGAAHAWLCMHGREMLRNSMHGREMLRNSMHGRETLRNSLSTHSCAALQLQGTLCCTYHMALDTAQANVMLVQQCGRVSALAGGGDTPRERKHAIQAGSR
jgi:hypothetical protein